MTNKQIIIDGVDVSGCIYFFDGYCNDNNDGFKCSLNSEHCYYKQLKAKEQECEMLKENLSDLIKDLKIQNEKLAQLEAYKMEAEEGKEINAELKAENEELRQILWNVDFNRQSKGKKLIRIEELLKKCATGYTDEFIQEMFSILHELEPVCRYNKLEEYSKTLTEIKEIAEACQTPANCKDYCKFFDKCVDGGLPLILQKISECEVEDDNN